MGPWKIYFKKRWNEKRFHFRRYI